MKMHVWAQIKASEIGFKEESGIFMHEGLRYEQAHTGEIHALSIASQTPLTSKTAFTFLKDHLRFLDLWRVDFLI